MLMPMSSLLFLSFFFVTFTLSFSLSLFFLYKTFLNKRKQRTHADPSLINRSISKLIDEAHRTRENSPTHLTHSLLLDLLPPDADGAGSGRDDGADESCVDSLKLKKKKKRAKKKRVDSESKSGENDSEERDLGASDPGRVKPELVCLYPFTSTGSATQRKIKQHYDQLVKCNETKGLTLAQVGEFANCLINAGKELQHKSEVIKRKFIITKALLCKADRSSLDRLCQQLYKLEAEQKRLEEDAFVYNWLQQQLKMSPAYKKMLEISASMELKENSPEQQSECEDSEFSDISFEELLAQEKKDAFWLKNGKPRSCST